MRYVAALLTGPDRPSQRAPDPWRLLAAAPLLALVLCALAAAGYALSSVPLATIAGRVRHVLPQALAGTLACAAQARPAPLSRPGLAWLLPGWLAVGVGGAGWSLVVLPQSPVTDVLRMAALMLPVMVLGLAGVFARLPVQAYRAAQACGAGPITGAALLARAVLPGLLRTLLAILALSAAVLAGGL